MAYINYGEDYGKLVTIVDIVDSKKVLVDGLQHFPRVILPLKRLQLTRIRVPILRGARSGTLSKAAKTFGLEEKWAKTSYSQRLEQTKKRNATTDFDRFKIMLGRKQRSFAVNKLTAKPKKVVKGAKAPVKAKK